MLSVKFFTSKKVGIGGGGQVSAHRVSCTLQLPWLAVDQHWLHNWG